MTPSEIRGPIKTQFGYHVLKLDEVEKGTLRSFDEARARTRSRVPQGPFADHFLRRVAEARRSRILESHGTRFGGASARI